MNYKLYDRFRDNLCYRLFDIIEFYIQKNIILLITRLFNLLFFLLMVIFNKKLSLKVIFNKKYSLDNNSKIFLLQILEK